MGFTARLTTRFLGAVVLPALLVVLLAAPGVGFDYFWDDFFFLTRGQSDPGAYLLPNRAETFYRPIPQGLYFRGLLALGPAGSLAGHLANLLLLAMAAVLVGSLAERLAGRRTGLFAGLVFAAAASVPSLAAWISGSQDLFALVFLLVALHLRHSGKIAASAAVALCALLSKETAAAAIPVLVAWDWIVGRRPARVLPAAAFYGAAVVAWAAIHPGLWNLAHAGFRSGATGYVGLERPERWWNYLFQYLLTLLNVPFTGPWTRWPGRLTLAAIAATLVVLAAVGRLAPRTPAEAAIPPRRLRLAGALLLVPPLLLPSLFVRPWASYFVAIAVPGFALLAAPFLTRARPRVAAALLAAFVLLGVWQRGMDVSGDGLVITEQRFDEASRATRLVRDRFRKLAPSFPPGSRVLLSVAGTGTLGIHQTLHDGQALRIWYRDPSLATVQPEWRRDAASVSAASAAAPAVFPNEFLFRVTPDLQVLEIDPGTSRFRSEGDYPDREEIAKPIRSYARGLAASGATDQAVGTLRKMASADSARLRSYDLRLAAIALRAGGRDAEARQLIDLAPPLSTSDALDMAGKVYAEPTRNPALDSLAFWAFGVSPDDPVALRYLIGQYRIGGYRGPALALARRLGRVKPGDSLAVAVAGPEAAR
ncbi:MAG TPA: hypothetical protein VK123_07910 [Candidatus Limnocylindrales bacterium]|nr:hypothetical protein [Candidatus Limnocylindrales bacterium]